MKKNFGVFIVILLVIIFLYFVTKLDHRFAVGNFFLMLIC